MALFLLVPLVLLFPLYVPVLLKIHGPPAKRTNMTVVSIYSYRTGHDLILPFAQVNPLLGLLLVPPIPEIQAHPGQNGQADSMELQKTLSRFCIHNITVESLDQEML